MSYILGISAYYHDSAAALIKNGEIISAVQEERFTRKKNDSSFPINSIKYILRDSNITISEIDYIVFYDKPFLKFERLLETYLSFVPRGLLSFIVSMPLWLKEKLFLKRNIVSELKLLDSNFNEKKLLFSEHHFSHAASAFYPSNFKEAIVLVVDGVGEWVTSTIAIGKESNINVVKEIHFPHSLGLLYSAFTYYCGFKVNSGEYKLMGLAPYGKPAYEDIILNNLIDLKDDGSFKLNQKYFSYATDLKMINNNFCKLFSMPTRKPDEELTQFYMDIAASIQSVTETIMLKITRHLADTYKIENLCLAGGVALNCVANGKIFKDKRFKNIWIQPAAGDSGGAIGAALAAWHIELKNPRVYTKGDSMKGSYLGPSFSDKQIEAEISPLNAIYEIFEEKDLIQKVAKDLLNGKAVGWFQGKMEFGPRALGNRSILANPLMPEIQSRLNLQIKNRESFRPFAPSILSENVQEWFDFDDSSPYMLFVANVNENKLKKISQDEKKIEGLNKLKIVRSEIPAVTHIDNSARLQTVHKETNHKYHSLISAFNDLTGCPILVNTSFNVRGEPIVCTPKDAFECFISTDMDILVINNFYLQKNKQQVKTILNQKNFALED